MVQGSGLLDFDGGPQLGWLAVGLAVITGVLHVDAGVTEGRVPVLIAGLGFLGAVGLYLVDYRRRLLYLVGIVYAAVQLPLRYVLKAGEYATIGYADKSIQVALVATVGFLYWRRRWAGRDPLRADRAERARRGRPSGWDAPRSSRTIARLIGRAEGVVPSAVTATPDLQRPRPGSGSVHLLGASEGGSSPSRGGPPVATNRICGGTPRASTGRRAPSR